MATSARQFTAALAVREHVPLLIGLTGPSGGGKTYSALRLATGIQEITGGDIFGIDTEANRMKHYADKFRFNHVPFSEPFGSLDYLDALEFCVGKGARVVIVDSMSHEHEGVGGLLDYHESELTRMAGDNYAKRESMKMLAWGKPKAARRKLINKLLQMNANFIFCFRAKNSVKPVSVVDADGRRKTEIVPQGFVPIAGDEFVFEMTLNALLLPGAGGVPTWDPDQVGEKLMTKLPEQFIDLMRERRPLDEKTGRFMAAWARGKEKTPPAAKRAPETAPAAEVDAPLGEVEPPLDDRTQAFDPAALGLKRGSDFIDSASAPETIDQRAVTNAEKLEFDLKTAEDIDALDDIKKRAKPLLDYLAQMWPARSKQIAAVYDSRLEQLT